MSDTEVKRIIMYDWLVADFRERWTAVTQLVQDGAKKNDVDLNKILITEQR